jgi:hypothetical protein
VWRLDCLYCLYGALSSERRYPPRGAACEPLAGCTHAMPSDRTTSAARSMMCGRLSRYDALLLRLAPDLEDMAVELGPCIQEEHAVVGSDTSPGIGTWPPPISPASEMVWWGARHGRVGGPRRAVPSKASDPVGACGLNRLGEGHCREDGGQPPCQHRLARPGRSQEKDVMARTPASASASRPPGEEFPGSLLCHLLAMSSGGQPTCTAHQS